MKQTMRKLALDADALRVETFATQESPLAQPGTVRAHLDRPSAPHTCGCPQTYEYTCYNTCYCPSWSGAECNTVCIG